MTPARPTSAFLTGPPGSAAVAGGSAEVVQAAATTLARGGSAVDAVLAGAFAAVMSEPVLASLGGGGFCLIAAPDAEPTVLDFFVDVPGRGTGPGADGGRAPVQPHIETVVVDFARAGGAASGSEQAFHGGWGTVAVPGCLDGYLRAHELAGRLPLSVLVEPAARMAVAGVVLSAGQRDFLHLVRDLLQLTDDSRALFAEADATGRYVNADYARLLGELGAGRLTGLADPALVGPLLAASDAGGGVLTAQDLSAYRPVTRPALRLARGAARVWTNPPPSVGGSIVVDALGRLEPGTDAGAPWPRVVDLLVDATARQRGPGRVPTGTTHVSVVDADGSFAAVTTSNGSGSGTVLPGWGVTLNNMLGEEDLRPADGSALPPGTRMRSMMAPTLVELADRSRVVMGTGGSERIRSALLGVLVRLVDEGLPLVDAVHAPRVHATGLGPIHVEPGFAAADVAGLADLARRRGWPGVMPWPAPNLYFGGVHAVRRAPDGSVEAVGDARRSGAAAVVRPDGSVWVR